MSCVDCGQSAIRESRETLRYAELGLPNLTLRDISVRTCSACGHRQLLVPDLAGLQRCLAGYLVSKAQRLTRPEITFLRQSLAWSKADCARNLHVWPEQVSRWESDLAPVSMQVQSELLLRALVALAQGFTGFLENLQDLASGEEASGALISLYFDERGWAVDKQGVKSANRA